MVTVVAGLHSVVNLVATGNTHQGLYIFIPEISDAVSRRKDMYSSIKNGSASREISIILYWSCPILARLGTNPLEG